MHRHLLVCAVATALQTLAQADNVVLESLHRIPDGWKKLRDAPAAHMIKLKVALKQPNIGLFEKTLLDVSNPEHPMYGKHLKRDELKEMMKPDGESTETVLTWLEQSGISSSDIQDDGDWVNFRTTVGHASKMLNTTFGVFGHSRAKVERIRALRYSVPEEVASHVNMVAPIIRFGALRGMGSTVFDQGIAPETLQAAAVPSPELDAAACNTSMTPECLRALYKIGDYKSEPTEKSLFGVCGYLEEWARHSQLSLFQDKYAPYTKDQNFSVVSINGGENIENDTAHSSVEANLDIQYAVAISYKTPTVYYTTGGRGPLVPDLDQPDGSDPSNEPYLEFLDYLTNLDDSKLPQTLTTSYGEPEQEVPPAYNMKVCNLFGQLGARGVSVIFSSGDTGPGSGCMTNDGKNTTRFNPIFPAACPWVTSIGGTHQVQPEIAVEFSSGGFSDLYERPAYQDAAVKKYLGILGNRWEGLFNPAGRGFPDVAAQGSNYHVFNRNSDIFVSGTSASAPMFAALIQLLNNARLKSGKPALGFLNPWLYGEAASGFTDITGGGSKGCTGRSIYSKLPAPFVPYASWNATEGWDPVTGLGTPLFDKLLQIANPGYTAQKIVVADSQ